MKMKLHKRLLVSLAILALVMLGSPVLNTASAAGSKGGAGATLATLNEGGPILSAPIIIKDEGFEGEFPNSGWQASGHWGKSNCNATSGAYGAWVEAKSGHSCGSQYHNSESGWMIYGPFSLADAVEADLDYKLWLESEYGYDYLFVGAALDGENFYGTSYTGDSSAGNVGTQDQRWNLNQEDEYSAARAPIAGWSKESGPDSTDATWRSMNFNLNNVYTLGNLAGKPQVWIAYHWFSDVAVVKANGAFLDEVKITKRIPITTPGKPKPTSPTGGSTVTTRRATLIWNAAARADTYNVIVKKDSKQGEELQSRNGLTETQFETKKLENGRTYFWRIQGCNAAGCKWSKWASFVEEP